jgi:8-oxo-dGTP pyrophosphatase MutT (NUDIX family)
MSAKYPLPLALLAGRLQNVLNQRPVCLAPAGFIARPASVFFPLCWHEGLVQVLFTKRTSHLAHHPGQVSFPGGAREQNDHDLGYTALRETSEEIGVACESMEILFRLDQIVTMTGFRITPFLGLIAPGGRFAPNSEEVEKIIMVPLVKVLNQDNYREEEIFWQGSASCWMALKHEGDIIWGATARILLSFIGALREMGADYKIALDIQG